jgi:hypothetical protein
LCNTSSNRPHARGKRKLAEVIGKAAVGIARCWDVLLKISERIGRDWEPVDTCVSDIADYCASSIDDPAAIESLDPDLVSQYLGSRQRACEILR